MDYEADDDAPYRPARTRKYRIDPPVALLRKFTARGFNKWLRDAQAARQEEERERDLPLLRKLVTRYPSTTRKMLQGEGGKT